MKGRCSYLREPARNALDGFVTTIDHTRPTYPVRPKLISGSAASRILNAAEEAELIVMGTHGLGGFAGLLVGAATTQVLRNADCAVVVLPGSG